MAPSRFPRKTPSQLRSRDTVEVILTAAARVFVAEGWGRTTTNRVAEVAGVSVGSLYQYFPNKLALLAALKERHIRRLFARLEKVFGRPGTSIRTGLRQAIRENLASSLAHRPLLLLFAEELPARLAVAAAVPVEAPHLAMLRRFFEARARELGDRDPTLAALVVGEMVDAVTRGALRDRPEAFSNGRLESELLEAALLYVLGLPFRRKRPRRALAPA